MQHPLVERAINTGYPYSERRQAIGIDSFGNEILPGDEIIVLHDDFFLVETMGQEAKEILEFLGATYEIAR